MLALSEVLKVKDIMILAGCGKTKATEIRQKALDYCIENDVPLYCRAVPTGAVLAVLGHDLEYYYDKMVLEHKALALRGEYVSA